MPHLLGMADHGQHRQDGFDQHSVVPFTALANLQVGRIAFGGMKACVGEEHGALVEHIDERTKPSVMGIRGRPDPAGDFPEMVDHHAPFGASDPTMVGYPGSPKLLWTAPTADRMDQLVKSVFGQTLATVAPGHGSAK